MEEKVPFRGGGGGKKKGTNFPTIPIILFPSFF